MFKKPFVFILPVLAILILFSTSDANAGSTVVVPNANEAVDGNGGNFFPFFCGAVVASQRYQQMYSGSEFGDTCFITEIRFRRDTSASDFGPTVIPNITVQLSTSPNDVTNMSATFADNIGSDVETVFLDDLTLSTNCGSDDPCPFDHIITLEQGFLYDPNEGDLLLDVRIPTCIAPVSTSLQDAVRDSSVISRAFTSSGSNVDSEVATLLNLANNIDGTDGLVTQFICGDPPPSGPADCTSVCSTASLPCDGTNTLCLCDTITGVADCLGTDGDDIMCGTSANETFRAGKGDDIICAGGGDDILHGGWGCDDLQGEGDGTIGDELHGGHCADSHIGGDGAGTDDCYGGWGDDFFSCDGTVEEEKTVDFDQDRGCVSVVCGNFM